MTIEKEEIKTKWDYRFYHLYYNGKRVKEIDVKTARKHPTWQIVGISKNMKWVNIRHHSRYVFFSLEQFKEVLKDQEEKQE